ncbi:30S ribosomal protein S4 [Patescibacteria group bacterium]|nr:30S ribosomal protein S4 [Patescibacteria group bacterium]MBU1703531.1 30S ribosomal protein S4 [Patescibacteria group bacterium]MBU1953438.1 30S ribosomal protein S4 [Patescibacteria group bacterium]
MSKYTGPKYRLCRREGINLFGNEKYNLKKKNYAPGQHGPKGTFSKQSEYARQLREKQKLKRFYGITERQMLNYYKKATRKKEITGTTMLKELESRFDNVIFRAGLANSRPQARQMVNHGHFKVNGIRMNIPSYQVKTGDKFEIVDRVKGSSLYGNLDKKKFAPATWIKIDLKKLGGEVVRELEEEDLEKAIQMNLVVEYYSK